MLKMFSASRSMAAEVRHAPVQVDAVTPTDTCVPLYDHTQKSPWYLLLYANGILTIVGSWLFRGAQPSAAIVLLLIGVLALVLGTSFQYLSVADQGDHLLIGFGPLPLFRRQVRYDDIRAVETEQTVLLDRWGIHQNIRGGLLWNLWGWDCVVIHLPNGIVRIGTDDHANLARFLRGKICDSRR